MQFSWVRALSAACVAVLLSVTSLAQEAAPSQQQPSAAPSTATPAETSTPSTTSKSVARLVLGPGDEGEITVYGVPDLSQKFRIDGSGDISLALIGRVKIGGLSAQEAEALIEKRYDEGQFLRNPHVNLTVKDYTTQGVTVLGEVTHPGTYSAMNVRRLFDAFQAAGGLTQRAGSTVTITRGAKVDTVKLSNDPADSAANNLTVEPGDTIVVSRAGIVYVLGEVTKPGGFVMEPGDARMTLMQVVAMASGPTRMAKLSKARIVRRTPTGLENMPLDVGKVLEAKSPDVPLQAEDIVFIPASKGKLAAEHGASSILSMVTQLAIYRF